MESQRAPAQTLIEARLDCRLRQRRYLWDMPLYFDAGITPIAILGCDVTNLWERRTEAANTMPMHARTSGRSAREVLG